MHSGLLAQNLELFSKHFPDRCDERAPALAISAAHTPNVQGEMTLAHEVGENRLQEGGRTDVHGLKSFFVDRNGHDLRTRKVQRGVALLRSSTIAGRPGEGRADIEVELRFSGGGRKEPVVLTVRPQVVISTRPQTT